MNLSKQILVLLAAALFLSGCLERLSKLETLGKEPPLGHVSTPMNKESFRPVDWPKQDEEQITYANSLWESGSRSFFKTKKTYRIGDIVKVIIKISDKAELDNETKKSRQNTETQASPKALGLENLTPGFIPKNIKLFGGIALDGSNSSTGTGTIEREEIIETEVAAMVTQILPNGNLVIHGDQEVRVNYEIRKITVDGIVMAKDITSDNNIDSSQIAEARISYGGRGHITDLQQPRLGHQILDIISPF